MTTHSLIVGGSTSKRVMQCPGSVALAAAAPPQRPSAYADEGTLLHTTIAHCLLEDGPPEAYIGLSYGTATLTQELIDEKILPALALFDGLDPDRVMDYQIEARVGFGDYLPGVFGSADVIGRIGNKAMVIDWKFGSGVMVEAENNEQLMFYAAAAARTEATRWAFAGATEVELVIIQPPQVRRWTTTLDRLRAFEVELRAAVRLAQEPKAPLRAGSWCKWCPASATCPQLTGEVDRTIRTRLQEIDPAQIGELLAKAEALETWLEEARGLASQMLTAGVSVPGYKLVQKRATRVWANEDAAEDWLRSDCGATADQVYETKMRSPAQIEKTMKLKLPPELVSAVSSGLTMVRDSDPRPAAIQIGGQLKAALSRI